jgi:hypothetical protein
LVLSGLRFQHPGDSEVEELNQAFRSDQNVAGFQITVDDEVPVSMLYGFANVFEETKALIDGESSVIAVLVDWEAGHVFHDVERCSILRHPAVQ